MPALSGLNKLVGFGLSMVLLAAASLVAIPAMIHSSGPDAWGAIALGQNFGAIAAMVVAYGWGISGPAEVAMGTAETRLIEFLGSMKVRLFLFVPVGLAAVLPTLLLTNVRPDLAAVGAVVATLPGLVSNWFFVGLARPYVLMLVETAPRVVFTMVGIWAMATGSDAIVGLAWQGGGLVAAFACSSIWILRHLKYRSSQAPALPSMGALLRQYGNGVASSIGSSLYAALPLAIVAMVAPSAQPMFALVDKLQRQVVVAIYPIISVLQGWVPRAANPAPRAKKVIIAGAGLSIVIALGTWAFGGWLMHLLGRGQLNPPNEVVAMMGVVLGLNFYVATLGHAVLATYKQMRALAISTAVGTVIAMPLVAVGAWYAGTFGALAAMAFGLLVRMTIKLGVSRRCLKEGAPKVGEPAEIWPEELV